MKMKRNAIWGISILLIILTIAGFRIQQAAEAEEMRLRFERSSKSIYASILGFDTYSTRHSHVWDQWLLEESTKFVLVYTREMASPFDYDINVIAVWPSCYTLEIMEGINAYVDLDLFGLFDFVDLHDFDLTFPLTVEDLVDHWSEVFRLWRKMGKSNPIENQAREIYDRGLYWWHFNRNWGIERWLHPGRLDALNELIESRDISVFDLAWPITEEDVHSDPRLIAVMARDVLTREELIRIQPESLDRE